MTLELLEPGCLYHIYNHAVGKENLFLKSANYSYFLRRYQRYITPVADTYAYCLMPNHLHFLIEVNQEIQIPAGNGSDPRQYVSKQFSNLFSSYAQAFNKQHNRRGNLFISRFRRKRIDSDEYISRLIRYIHLNPVHHGFIQDFSKWGYSSYGDLLLPTDTFLAREKVIRCFGSLEAFKKAHQTLESSDLLSESFEFPTF